MSITTTTIAKSIADIAYHCLSVINHKHYCVIQSINQSSIFNVAKIADVIIKSTEVKSVSE